MKIIVADRISEHGVKLLADPGWQVVQPAAASLASELAEADALVVRSATRVTDELLSQARRLRVIGRAGVGVDNIDLDAVVHGPLHSPTERQYARGQMGEVRRRRR